MAKRIPPSTHGLVSMMGLTIRGYDVGSWRPDQAGEAKPEAVCVRLIVDELPDLVLRLKTPAAVDTMIQGLLRHKRNVWPEAS